MRVYSKHDVLGQVLNLPRASKHSKSFYHQVVRMISSFSTMVEVQVTVPSFVYLRAKILCEHIEEEYEMAFRLNDLIWILYKDFMRHSFHKADLYQVYKTFQERMDDSIEVYHYGQLVERFQHKSTQVNNIIVMKVPKKEVRDGEALLAEMDTLYPNSLMFEDMVSQLLIHFMEQYKHHSSKDMVHSLVKKAERYMER
ncbi:hypothetical protein GLW08_13255 [Pontibacillus yanchengensis]|uniref:Uncharacterized protein n=2 Tax=Pontibacillus yanchengensis TaxID=462910 RepID=A0ACC7VH53_9BACI|nr:hypothetical protein [Pontibacillus yanchengensis]MYL34488.1 hypothetical protein [Pontibacillus yanchengensis]MYL54296.1 hypothetical protein [Pontibacillus yanchengensis]